MREGVEEMEATLTQSRVAQLDEKAGFRQSARALDDERFRTRTITKEELPSPSSSPEKQTSSASSSSSSRSSKQRRADEASRFLTQTIGPGDLVRREEEEESMTAAALESEALRVVASLSELKAGRSRSQSAEILGESEMHDSREDLCRTREASRELDSRGSSRGGRVGDRSQSPADGEGGSAEKARPRVCKPWESRVQEQEVAPPPAGIRGRRRALYSPPMKRATVPPPVAPKPNLAARGRPASSPQTSPRLVRGTRATQLRQANSRKETSGAKTTSPRTTSPRSSSTASPRSTGLGSPRTLSTSSGSPKLARQQ